MKRIVRERKKESLKHHIELLSLIFILTLIAAIMIFSTLDKSKISDEKREEYVDALKESKIAEIIGISDTPEGENEFKEDKIVYEQFR